MSTHPMVTEVNRLIGDLLAAGLPLALPGIGTLRPERRPARRISKKQLLPPARIIDFSSTVQGTTLARRLAEAARCTDEQAEEIYRRWLGYTQQEEMLTIVGVGTLKMKHFTLDPEFDRRINPQGHAPITVRRRRRFDWTIAVGLVAVAATAAICGYGYLLWQEERTANAPQNRIVAEQATAGTERTAAEAAPNVPTEAAEPTAGAITAASPTAPAPTAPRPSAETPAESAPAAQRPAVASPVAPEPRSEGVMTMSSGRYYVVLGVFSTVENAERAVNETARKDGSLRCGIYRFGGKWMVSPFESADAEACTLFRNAHLDRFPDTWVYRAR